MVTSGYPVEGRVAGDTHIKSQQLIVVSSSDVQRGLSGAPLFDKATGRVFAIVNAKFDDKGVGFAIPISSVTRLWPELKQHVVSGSERLRTRVSTLYRSMGYQVAASSSDTGNIAREFAATLRAGPTELRVAVLCIDTAEPAHVADVGGHILLIAGRIANRDADKALIVSRSGLVRDAENMAASAGIACISFRQLEDSLIDFTGYANRVVYDFENFDEYHDMRRYPVIEYFRWCNLFKYYVDLHAIDPINRQRFPSTIAALREFLDNDASRHISVLGDYGTGKTSLCLQLTYDLAKAYLADPVTNRIPLFLPLRNFDPRVGIKRFIVDTLSDYEIKVFDFSAFEIVLRSGRIVLILDGFDEMADRLDRQGVLRAFNQLSHLATPSSKVILTCRTHYFRSENQSLELLTPDMMTPLMYEVNQRNDYRVIEILKFDERQILDRLSRQTSSYENQWTMMRSIYNLSDLATTPILLNIIINSLAKLVTVRSPREINSAGLYDIYTKFWLERDDDRSSVTNEERSLFAEELAWRMFETDTLLISSDQLREAVSHFFLELYQRGRDWLDLLDVNIRTCSYLARDKNGNYLFAHKSFMEFFVAKRLARRIGSWTSEDYWARIIPYEVVAFLQELLTDADIQKVKQYSLNRTNNELLRSLCMDLQIAIGDTVKEEPLVLALTASPNGDHIASAHADCTTRIWTSSSLQLLHELHEHSDWVRGVAYSSDNKYFATAGWDARVNLWSLPSYAKVLQLNLSERVNAVYFSPDNNILLTAGYDNLVSIWSIPDGRLLHTIEGHFDNIRGVVMDRSSKLVISAGFDKSIRVTHLNEPSRSLVVGTQDEPITCIAIAASGKYIATGTWSGNLTLWDGETYERIRVTKAHTNMINAIDFNLGSNQLATCSDDREVRIWSCATGSLIQVFLAGVDFASGLSYNQTSEELYVGGYDSRISVWSTESWDKLASVQLHGLENEVDDHQPY